jgi:predicted adenylyl cyclase CyaB
MREIEVKILDVDIKGLVAKLKKIGAKKVESGLVRITALDFPDEKLRKNGSYIRVRTFGHRTELVLKKNVEKSDFKIMDETETTLGDYETALKLFREIGIEAFAKQEKYRATYKLDNIKFEIDKYPTLNWFVEVEAESKDDVIRGVELLGFSMSQTTSKSGKDLFKGSGITDPSFTFKDKGESPDYDSLFK